MQQSAPDPGASSELQTLNSPATASDHSQRAFPTPFLTKTYQLVDDPELDELISWGSDGSTFVVWRPNEFARDILPKHFKHNNFSSFVRQLNTYGFRKIVPDRWEFSNDGFKRGEKRLLRDIQRRKNNIPPAINPTRSPSNSGEEQVLSSNSTPSVTVAIPITVAAPPPGTTAELLDENERLRKQNQALSQDLSRMKNICNSIFVLMSKYSSVQQETQHETIDLLRGEGVMKVEEIEEGCSWRSPMLFGVSIGEKRKKGLEEEKLEESGSGADLGLGFSPEMENRRPWVVYCPRPRRVGMSARVRNFLGT